MSNGCICRVTHVYKVSFSLVQRQRALKNLIDVNGLAGFIVGPREFCYGGATLKKIDC